jgi:hypothetical protein
MSTYMKRTALLSTSLVALLLVGCGVLGDDAARAGDDLTSVAGVEHVIDFDSFVDVPVGASDDAVRGAVHRQLKSALGALRERKIGVADRDAQRNLAGQVIVRTPLAVVDASGAVIAQVDRVRFHYHDVALVEQSALPLSSIDLTLLFGDYVARAGELTPLCSDDASSEPDSLWYHFAPRRSTCRTAIRNEQQTIADATALLADPAAQIAARDADRRFVSMKATLAPVVAAPDTYPEYDRLWGFAGDTSRQKLVVYAFFGVDSDETNPADNGLVEFLRFQRTLRTRFPALR